MPKCALSGEPILSVCSHPSSSSSGWLQQPWRLRVYDGPLTRKPAAQGGFVDFAVILVDPELVSFEPSSKRDQRVRETRQD